MRTIVTLPLLLLLSSCATSTASRTSSADVAMTRLREVVPPDDARLWQRIRKERVQTLLPSAMKQANVDAWLVFVRENDNDPLALHVGGENAGGTAAFIFSLDGDRVRSVALSPVGEAVALRDIGLHDEVAALERGVDVFAAAAERLRSIDPRRIAVNTSSRAAVDGLSHTQHEQLQKSLGENASRLTSAEELVIAWLSVKLPEEVEIMRRAADVTAALEHEAYATVVPGRTSDAAVAQYLKRRMRELGLEDAWAPEQNPNVNSGPDRGHSHATARVIQSGDVIQTDFGIKVGGVWCTDVQRFAYVLRQGEKTAPQHIQRYWEIAKKGNRIALESMRPDTRGYDVDAAQRAWMRQNSSEPVPWSTGHPVGYWAHDLGPSLGGAQRESPPSGDAVRVMQPGQTFAFDGFFSWKLSDGNTKTISVEEMAVVESGGARYLTKPQEELILIGK